MSNIKIGDKVTLNPKFCGDLGDPSTYSGIYTVFQKTDSHIFLRGPGGGWFEHRFVKYDEFRQAIREAISGKIL